MEKENIKKLLIKEIPEEQILFEESMAKHTTFKIGGIADIFIRLKNNKELRHVIKIAEKENIHLTIIGNGSNILVTDKGIRGIVAKIEFEDIKIEKSLLNKTNRENKEEKTKLLNREDVIVTVGAGVKLTALVQKLLQEEITGFEFAAGIPGTIGGAIKMNAGAYGKEMKDIVIETKCLDFARYNMSEKRTNIDDIEIVFEKKNAPDVIILNNKEQDFSYRHSIFMEQKYIILETKLKLKRGRYEKIEDTMNEYMKNRKETQPISVPSAGSTFKRGKDYVTAKLIDECGLKGYKIGEAQVSEKHAGFIVNTGNATAQDVIDLIDYVKNTVYRKTGYEIEMEIEILGEK